MFFRNLSSHWAIFKLCSMLGTAKKLIILVFPWPLPPSSPPLPYFFLIFTISLPNLINVRSRSAHAIFWDSLHPAMKIILKLGEMFVIHPVQSTLPVVQKLSFRLLFKTGFVSTADIWNSNLRFIMIAHYTWKMLTSVTPCFGYVFLFDSTQRI